jgi:hypothetical protein
MSGENGQTPRVVLLRVGVDSGVGGIQGPLLDSGRFDYIPIPDTLNRQSRMLYGNTRGRHGRFLYEYWSGKRQHFYRTQAIHFDPEFSTFTYGDPTRPKQSLRFLRRGDLLVFYAGLQPWSITLGFHGEAQLYIIGYFAVNYAGRVGDLLDARTRSGIERDFVNCHHVPWTKSDEKLVLVKGATKSRLLGKAALLSEYDKDKNGVRIKVLRADLRRYFGQFSPRNYLQRSPPRWIPPEYSRRACAYVMRLN